MSFSEHIQKRIFKKKLPTGRQSFEDILFVLSKKTSTSASELMTLPIPLVLSLNDSLYAYYKEKEKAAKKK